jgi:hypothetical protein
VSEAGWNTPQRLRALLAAVLVATALLYTLGLQALKADRASLDRIGRDTAPNIVAAQELGAHLAGLDGELSSALLGAAADRDVANELFELRRSSATRRLDDAADISGSNPSERIPILIINEELGRYLELAGRAQWLYAQGDRDGANGLLRLATNLMHQRILPSADALDAANRSEMDREFADARSASMRFETGAMAAGVLLLAALVTTHFFISARMRRRTVPALLAASLLTVAFTGYLVTRLRGAREDLRVMHDDSFNSIHAMWRARAVAADANGDESRWLLDRSRASDYEAAFRAKAARLLTQRPLTGLLADELANVTFRGEQVAAEEAVAAMKEFLDADGRVRQEESKGAHAVAIATCLGAAPVGKDDWHEVTVATAFDRFDEAAQRVININQWAFDAALGSGDSSLTRAEWLEPAFAIAIAVCAWLGVRARLREYA